jgi:tubulin-specific chaperone D
MINHLFRIKLCHWDPAIRVLSAQALSDLTPLEVEYVESTVIPYLLEGSLDPKYFQLRHGAVRGLAEIVLAYGVVSGHAGQLLRKETMDAIAELVPVIEKKRLYRGKGGELMRAAVCRLIECISRTHIPLTVPQQVRMTSNVSRLQHDIITNTLALIHLFVSIGEVA